MERAAKSYDGQSAIYKAIEIFYHFNAGEVLNPNVLDDIVGTGEVFSNYSSCFVPAVYVLRGEEAARAMAKGAYESGCPQIGMGRLDPNMSHLFYF